MLMCMYTINRWELNPEQINEKRNFGPTDYTCYMVVINDKL